MKRFLSSVPKRSLSTLARKFCIPKPVGKLPKTLSNFIKTKKLPDDDLTFDNVVDGRNRFLSPSLSTFQAFKKPFYPKFGYMQYLWDHEGNQYLDLLAQNLTIGVGHNHPTVVGRVNDQMDKMVHCTTMYYNDSPVKAAKRLLEVSIPEPIREDYCVHFVNSGSEAIDLAVQMARVYTGNWQVLALRNSYHGLHGIAQSSTGMSVCKQPIPDTSGVLHVMHPDSLRGQFPFNDIESYVREIEETINYSTPGKVAAFMFEQVQGYGGIGVLPKNYWQMAAQAVRKAGGLVIADEVQGGYYRLSDKDNHCFWSFEMFGEVPQDEYPDMVVTAKGLGNGFPIAAVITKKEIAQSIVDKRFFNTYGGNPTVSAAAQGVMDVVGNPDFPKYVDDVGTEFRKALEKIRDNYAFIGEVRGRGLMYGVEIVRDRRSNEPDGELAADIFEEMRDQGVIMGLGGYHKNVLRVMPPMAVTKEDAEFMYQVFDDACRNAVAEDKTFSVPHLSYV